MFKLFGRVKDVSEFLPEVSQKIDVSHLDTSLELLKTATSDVSAAAASAAETLNRLQETEHRFLSTIDSIDDLVIIKDADGRWVLLNKWGQELYQWHHGEFYMKTDLQLAEMYPTLRSSLMTCHETDEQAWQAQSSHRTSETVPQGATTYYLDVIKTPVFNPDGTRKELIVVGRDVTAIAEKNKRTKACFHALNAASDVIFIIDGNGKMYFCNDPFLQAFNLASYEGVIGKPVDQILPDLGQYTDMWERTRSNRIWEGRYRENYNATVLPVMNGLPKPIYYVCTLKPRVIT